MVLHLDSDIRIELFNFGQYWFPTSRKINAKSSYFLTWPQCGEHRKRCYCWTFFEALFSQIPEEPGLKKNFIPKNIKSFFISQSIFLKKNFVIFLGFCGKSEKLTQFSKVLKKNFLLQICFEEKSFWKKDIHLIKRSSSLPQTFLSVSKQEDSIDGEKSAITNHMGHRIIKFQWFFIF